MYYSFNSWSDERLIKESMFSTALYIRLSREDGDKDESDSVINQRKMLKEYVKNSGDLVLYGCYEDDGYSGISFERPAFKKMMKDIEAGIVNCVIVKDLSRFGRDYIETGRYLERYFPENNVRFIAVTDNIDSFRHSYDMLLPIKNVFNEQYARDISKKVQSSFKTKQKTGEFIGAFTSYGYKKSSQNRHKLEIDEYAADVVCKIFQLFINGYGKVKIAHNLNEEGVPCPSEYKRLSGENYANSNRLEKTFYWTYSTINMILKNEMYIGNMVQGKTKRHMKGKAKTLDPDQWIRVKGTHEPIISNEVWEKAQILLKRRTRNLDLNSNTSIFAGYLVCGDCGRAMTKKYSYCNGKKYYRYSCGTYTRCGSSYCSSHTISFEILEKIILDDLNVVIQGIKDFQPFIEQAMLKSNRKMDDNELQRLNSELGKVQKQKMRVYEDYSEDLLSRDEYMTYHQNYLKKEKLLKSKILLLSEKQEEISKDIYEEPWVKGLVSTRQIDHLDRETVVDMIHKISVYEDNHIKIIYNFSNEPDTLAALSTDIIVSANSN